MRCFPVLELIALVYIFVLRIAYIAQTAQPSQDLTGTAGFARWFDGFYYRGQIISSSESDQIVFRSVWENDVHLSFSPSDWQAFVPDVTPVRKSTPSSSRVITPIFTNKYQAGTIVYINASSFTYKVRHDDGGGESYFNLTDLRIMHPGFAEFGHDCLDLLYKGYTQNGFYYIYPDGTSFIKAFCDQETNGGGWTVFQRRFDGSVDFFRDWNSYKEGFGDFGSEFWLGNDDIHKITLQDSQLLIELEDLNGETAHAFYDSFRVGSENEKYVLHLGEFTGTEGDSMSFWHNGMKFSTKDQDNDYNSNSCAQTYTGAWWYNKCHSANLNGQYGVVTYGKGINWQTRKGHYHSLKATAMKVRPRRERDVYYELVFSGALSDYVRLPRITDFRDVSSCWWMKTLGAPDWQTVFSLHSHTDNTSVLSFSFSLNGHYEFRVNSEVRTFHLQNFFITDAIWHHVCTIWFSESGKWKAFIDGKMWKTEKGLTPYRTGIGYLVIGRFQGSLAHFNIWDKDVGSGDQLRDLGRSLITGNVVPWPEIQFWRSRNVTKKKSSFCKLSGFQSSMISHIPRLQDVLMGWTIEAPLVCERYWVPCFRGAVDGWHSHIFHRKCDNLGPTLTIARKGSYLFGGFADKSWKNHSPAQSIYSQRSFLFSLKPFNTAYGAKKFGQLEGKKDKAMRGSSDKGPCWGMDAEEMCFSPRAVKTELGSSGVFNDKAVPDISTFFTGESSFQAEDVEVLALSDYKCDPPCREDEYCDEISGECVCHSSLRGEEICKLRQGLQKLKDQYCINQWANDRSDCHGRLFARYSIANNDSTKAWRCYYEESLTGDHWRYDTGTTSNCYHEDNGLKLEYFADEVQNCRALGMERTDIFDSQISSSSDWSANHAARNARLNVQAVNGRTGAWSARSNDANQWLQVDFVKTVSVVRVSTQGRMDSLQWVKSYSLSQSMGGSIFEVYQQSGVVKIFNGNTDQNTIISHVLHPVIFTRFIRILPKTWNNHISMRAEFYECDGYDVFEVDDFLVDSKFVFTFDDVTDIKDVRGEVWAQVNGSLQAVTGVRGGAVKTLGDTGTILLSRNPWGRLIYITVKQHTFSLWLLYQCRETNVAQSFFAVGNQENGGGGTHLYQEDGSREDLTFKLTGQWEKCLFTFNVPQRVWSHLVFTWTQIDQIKVYRNGKLAPNVAKHCDSIGAPNVDNKDIKLGSSNQLPLASFDDLIYWKKALSASQVEKLFRFYKGGSTLLVHVSLELPNETFDPELMQRGSERFKNKTALLESQTKALYEERFVSKVESFQFRKMTHVGVNFTVQFYGIGYKMIEPLETSLASRGMLGSMPIIFIDMVSIDVYTKQLQVKAYNTSSTSIAVSWTDPGNLSRGIFCGVEILYHLSNSEQKFRVMRSSLALEHELTNLLPYTWYFISARPHTFKGEGKESEGVLTRTGEDAPTLPPENVHAFLNKSGVIIVTWQPVPVQHRLGVIQGYKVMYTPQTIGNPIQKTVSTCNLSVVLHDLEIYTLYSITVAAYTRVGQGPSSQPVEVRTKEDDLAVDPVNITNTVPTSTSIGLSWMAPDPYKLGEVVSEYRVEVVDLLRRERIIVTVNSSSTSIQLDFLKPFTSYEFKLYSSTSSWEGNITDTISLKTEEDAPSESPRNLTVHYSTPSATKLQWKPVHKYFINGRLRGYKVKYKKTLSAPSSNWSIIVININGTQQSRNKRSAQEEDVVSFNLEGLRAYTSYTVIVLAFTIKDGIPTVAKSFTTAEMVPDKSPTNVTAYDTSSTRLNITWQPIPSDHVNGILLDYNVIYRRIDKLKDNISMVTVNSTVLHTELSGLGKYKQYSIQVAGRTAAGRGNFSEPVFVRTKQDVPDDPPRIIRAIGIEPTVLKAYWLAVSNETINGIGLGYKLSLFTTAGTKIRDYTLNASVLSLEITGLDIWTNYSIRMAAFTIVGDGPWSDLILEDTDEEVPYKAPENPAGMATSSTSIFVKWDAVDLPIIRGILRSYTVYYEEASSSVHPSVLRNVTVDISVTEVQLINLHKYAEYHIWVTASTTRQGLKSNSLFVRTLEDIPDRPPLYITYTSPTSTTILLHWSSVLPQFANGIIRGFRVEYQKIGPLNSTVKTRERFLVTWVLLDGLKKFTEYSVRVRAFTSVGYGPENVITVLTSQDVPSKPPSSINAEGHVSLTTVPVSWQPIDPLHINGVLLGYKIRYQAVASGEEPAEDQPVLEKTVGTSTLTVMLENLDIFALYRVDVLGYTVIGEGPAATDYAETCRCYKRLTTSWYEFPPYVQVQDNNIPSGLIPPILSKLAVTCCQTCQSHGKSYVNFTTNGLNTSARLRDLRTFKSSIGNPTDFFFPAYGFKDQTHFAKEFGYHGLVESPGMAYIIHANTQDDVPNAVLSNVISCWPAVTLLMVITYLSGLVVWAVESSCNPQDFPSSFTKGVPEGFYWAFVSTTTVGYGDRAPISFMGRILAIVVILTGLVLFSLVNGILATSITSVAFETDYKIYGAKVAAIAETPEYRMGVRKNARMDEGYSTFDDIFTALHERKATGALIDTYSAGSNKDIFAKHHFRVNKILDYSSTYGVVMGKEARKLRKCFNDLTQHVFASEISEHIQKNTDQLKEPDDSLPVERSTGLFDSDSVVFQNTLLLTSSLLISCLLLGIMYEIIRYRRSRARIKPHESWHISLNEMKAVVDHFHQNMVLVKKMISSRHKKERKALLLFYQKEPKRKYESMTIITEGLFTDSLSVEDEAHC